MHIIRLSGGNIGEFQEADHGSYFTYKATNDKWAVENGYSHEIDVLDGVRFANVKRTVAYVVIDEDADGKPVVEKWFIKRHNVYE